ncbi:MAG: SGNH/GDSL hydrolase family protein, partial [Bacteroidota bacterium]
VNSTSYIDSDLLYSTSYEYTVYNYNATDTSAMVTVSIATAADPNAPPEIMRTYLIDLGDPSNPTIGNWNNVTGRQDTGVRIDYLQSTDGNGSNISFVVVDEADNGYGLGEGFNPEGYNGVTLGYPVTACSDSYFSRPGGGIYELSGLQSYMTYGIKLFGSRASGTGGRVGTYTINGITQTLDALNNSATFITFDQLQADASGKIILDFDVAAGSSFGYINVLELTEQGVPPIAAPDSLVAILTNSLEMTLSWRDNADNETGVEVLRSTDNTSFESIAVLPANSTGYNDLVPQNTFNISYVVRAFNGTNEVFGSRLNINLIEMAIAPKPLANLTYQIVDQDVELTWTDTLNVVILGSSTAFGVGASSTQNSWVNRLSSWLPTIRNPSKLVNLAVSGFTTYDVRNTGSTPSPDTNHNIDRALSLDPDIIIINLPSNNVATGVPLATTLNHYRELLSRAESEGIKTFLTTSQPRNLTIAGQSQLRAEATSLLNEFPGVVINVYDELANADGLGLKTSYDSGDGIHLNDAGHSYLFTTIRDFILDYVDTELSLSRSDGGSPITLANIDHDIPNYVDSTVNLETLSYYQFNETNPDGTTSSLVQVETNGLVDDILELQALRDLYESTNGDNWTSQTDADPANDWPRTSVEWEAVTSVDQVVGWSGLTFENGDITRLDLSTKKLGWYLAPFIK